MSSCPCEFEQVRSRGRVRMQHALQHLVFRALGLRCQTKRQCHSLQLQCNRVNNNGCLDLLTYIYIHINWAVDVYLYIHIYTHLYAFLYIQYSPQPSPCGTVTSLIFHPRPHLADDPFLGPSGPEGFSSTRPTEAVIFVWPIC